MNKPFEKELVSFYINSACLLFDSITRNHFNLEYNQFESLERVAKVLLSNENNVSLNAIAYNVCVIFSEYSKRKDRNPRYFVKLSETVEQLKRKYNV